MNKHFKDELSYNVWQKKYALKDKSGKVLESSPDDMHLRLAKEYQKINAKYNNKVCEKLSDYGQERNSHTESLIFDYFKDFTFIVPQGRIMAGLGVNTSFRSLSNCLVLPSPNDSYSSIMYVDTMLVSAAKRGCGFGIDLSNLRPENSPTNNASDSSTGVISFMDRYSNSTREVGQNSRRGACLLGIDSNHPDIFKFLKVKHDRTKVTGANISVKCRNDLFESVKSGGKYLLKFNDIKKEINATDLWSKLTENSHQHSEPGIFIWDRVNNYDPCSVYKNHKITLTNACGEQPMSKFDTCRLMVVNLYSYVNNPFKINASINEDLLYKMCYEQLWLGDNLVDLEVEYIDRIIDKIIKDPEPDEEKEIELILWKNVKEKALSGRRVGCGITGLGDMLAAMNVRYGSKESADLVEKVMCIKMKAELDASIDLSILRGSFPDYNHDKEYVNDIGNNDFYIFLKDKFPEQYERMKLYGRRNINWNTIAPTGTTSLMTQTTSGCEPCFMVTYKRRRKINPNDKSVKISYVDELGDKWEEYTVFHHKFIEWYMEFRKLRGLKFKDFKECVDHLSMYSDEELQGVIKHSPYFKSCANDLNWEERVNIQSILQKYTTSAISSTINLPENISKEIIGDIYMKAYESGCKGVTVYREGSRNGVLISNKKKEENKFNYTNAAKRNKELECDIYHKTALKKDWMVVVGKQNGLPYEIFVLEDLDNHTFPTKIKTGVVIKNASKNYKLIGKDGEKEYTIKNIIDFMSPDERVDTRKYSSMLRHGMNPKYIRKQIKEFATISSFDKVVERVLKNYVEEDSEEELCPECENKLIMQDGCKKCLQCGYSACG